MKNNNKTKNDQRRKQPPPPKDKNKQTTKTNKQTPVISYSEKPVILSSVGLSEIIDGIKTATRKTHALSTPSDRNLRKVVHATTLMLVVTWLMLLGSGWSLGPHQRPSSALDCVLLSWLCPVLSLLTSLQSRLSVAKPSSVARLFSFFVGSAVPTASLA